MFSPEDPWGLLNKALPSKHCDGRTSRVTSYDHTGSIRALCECGTKYWHDHGVHCYRSELDTTQAADLFTQEN